MIKVEIIGNLGADAQLQEKNGNRFVAFRVANTDKWVDKSTGQVIESTQWISCTLNGAVGLALAWEPRAGRVVRMVEEIGPDDTCIVDFEDLGLVVRYEHFDIVAG